MSNKQTVYLDPDMGEIQTALEALDGKKSKGTGMFGTHNYGSTSDWWAKQHDHEGKTPVYESNGKILYAGNGRGVDETADTWDLIIDLASQLPYENPHGCIKERSHKRFDRLRKWMIAPKKVQADVLSLDWPDMGTLPVTLDFWLELWGMLPAKTLAMCVGGHGRTGTCLAALMIADGIDYYSAIDHVRTHHCKDAIESVNQTRYLHNLYVQMLKRNIKHEKDAQVLADLQADLDYAEEYVPNNYSDHGDKEPPKPAIAEAAKTNGHASTVQWGDRLKLINGVLYEQVCLIPNCESVPECTKPDHLGWVEYDVDVY